ncbi:MAG: hypothetical protein KAV87_20770 [Desulfobacteraceae bacterium]|nr:hypothetical protein [Desulfobacteraceae bacterium]
MVFNKRWFKQHEKIILLVANTCLGRFFFGITGSVPRGKQVTEILPASVTWLNDKGVYHTEFLTFDRFGLRLYSGLKPFWYLLHFIDWLFSFAPLPQLRLNFGFDTLTAYPAAGANAPVDGYTGRTSGGESFSDLRSNAGTLADVSEAWGPIASLKGGTVADEFTRIDRGIFLFDTSSIDDDGTVNSATLSLYGDYKANSLGLSDAEAGLALVGASPASDDNLVSADYQSLGAVRYSSDISFSSFDTFGYNDFTLNAAGLAAISKTSLSRFGTRQAIDLDGGTPTWVSSVISELWIKFRDIGSQPNYPKLVVQWTPDAIEGYVTADDEIVVSAFPEITDDVTADDEVSLGYSASLDEDLTADDEVVSAIGYEIEELIWTTDDVFVTQGAEITDDTVTDDETEGTISSSVDAGDAEASDETVATLITFASELNKKVGAAPVWILKCPFATGTIYLSDRVFSVSGWEGGITTKGWVKRWSAIDEDIASELASPLVSDMSLDFVIDPAAATSIHDILWDDLNNVGKTDCELYLWFLGFEGLGVFPQTFWSGNIIDFEQLDELTYSVQLIDQSVGFNKSIGKKLNTTDWPGADPDDIGKLMPIVYGSVTQVQALAVDAGKVTSLATTTTEAATALSLTDTEGLAAGKTVQIEEEQILIGAVSGNLITGCTRGYSSTTATTHDKGMEVGEVKTEYWYLLADHPVKSIGNVYVDGVRQTGSDFVKYTDSGGQAFVKFTTLPVLSKSVDVEVDDNIEVQDYTISNPDHDHDYVQSVNQFSTNLPTWSPAYPGYDQNIIFPATANKTSANYDIAYSKGSAQIGINGYIKVKIGGITVYHVDYSGGTLVDKPSPLKFSQGSPTDFVVVEIEGSDGLSPPNSSYVYFSILSAERICELDSAASATAQASTKTDANKAKTDGGKAYYVGLTGNSSADTVIGTQITANVEGYKDDGSGTYTGTPNALIERPDHVMKHLLAVYAGFTNFTTNAGSEFATKGYTFAGVIKESKKLRHWTNYLAWQSRCYFRFAGGEAQLLWRPDAITPLKTITANMIRRQEDHKTTLRGPKLSPLHEVVNVIDLHYDRDWTKDGEEAYKALEPGSDVTSIGKYGEKDHPELFFFDFVIDQTMAADVLAFYLARLKNRKKDFSMELFLDNSDLIFGKGITLEPAGNIVCEVLKINTYPGSGKDMRNDQVILSVRGY